MTKRKIQEENQEAPKRKTEQPKYIYKERKEKKRGNLSREIKGKNQEEESFKRKEEEERGNTSRVTHFTA